MEYNPVRQGKVRDIYDFKDKLIIITTDRISAFDYVLPTGIPEKGKILHGLTKFWLNFFSDVNNHFVSDDPDDMPEYFRQFKGRAMVVRKCEPLPVECVIRGYLSGNGWKEYRQTGKLCQVKLPAGLQESQQLLRPVFTPTTKAESGHDENITCEQMAELVRPDVSAGTIVLLTRDIYAKASAYAWDRGIIIADTKLEFGVQRGCGDVLTLIDEVLTPDSSRFWPLESYCIGSAPPSLDKQYVRDYLLSTEWDRNSPPPELPPEVVERTTDKYIEIYEKLTGEKY